MDGHRARGHGDREVEHAGGAVGEQRGEGGGGGPGREAAAEIVEPLPRPGALVGPLQRGEPAGLDGVTQLVAGDQMAVGAVERPRQRQGSLAARAPADLEHRQPRPGPQTAGDLGVEHLLVRDVHLDVDGVRGVEPGVAEGADVTAEEPGLLREPRGVGEDLGRLHIGGGDVDADHVAPGGPGDLPRGTAEPRADVQRRRPGRERQMRYQALDRGGPADVVLVDPVPLRRGYLRHPGAHEPLDGGDDVGLRIGHDRAPHGSDGRAGRRRVHEFLQQRPRTGDAQARVRRLGRSQQP